MALGLVTVFRGEMQAPWTSLFLSLELFGKQNRAMAANKDANQRGATATKACSKIPPIFPNDWGAAVSVSLCFQSDALVRE